MKDLNDGYKRGAEMTTVMEVLLDLEHRYSESVWYKFNSKKAPYIWTFGGFCECLFIMNVRLPLAKEVLRLLHKHSLKFGGKQPVMSMDKWWAWGKINPRLKTIRAAILEQKQIG